MRPIPANQYDTQLPRSEHVEKTTKITEDVKVTPPAPAPAQVVEVKNPPRERRILSEAYAM